MILLSAMLSLFAGALPRYGLVVVINRNDLHHVIEVF